MFGDFDTEEEPARAYNNASYYLHAAGFRDAADLNFPEEYKVNPADSTYATSFGTGEETHAMNRRSFFTRLLLPIACCLLSAIGNLRHSTSNVSHFKSSRSNFAPTLLDSLKLFTISACPSPHYEQWEAGFFCRYLFPAEFAAAKAYDNATFWFGERGRRKAKLNLSGDYSESNLQPPNVGTYELMKLFQDGR